MVSMTSCLLLIALIGYIPGTESFSFMGGSCPSPPEQPDCDTRDENHCETDKDCKAEEMCCNNGCIKVCIKETINMVLNPINTEPSSSYTDGGKDTSKDCNLDLSNFEKTGRCPAIEKNEECDTGAKECSYDAECGINNDLKCCLNSCDVKRCRPLGGTLKPVEPSDVTDMSEFEKSGNCPIFKENENCDSLAKRCVYDLQCGFKNKLKCCPDGCGVQRCLKSENACINKKHMKMTIKVEVKDKQVKCVRCNCDQLTRRGDDFMKAICHQNIKNVKKNCCRYCEIFKSET